MYAAGRDSFFKYSTKRGTVQEGAAFLKKFCALHCIFRENMIDFYRNMPDSSADGGRAPLARLRRAAARARAMSALCADRGARRRKHSAEFLPTVCGSGVRTKTNRKTL